MPLVSVIMGAYNCEHTLADAIDSILVQTYADWELVLCIDGGSDSSYRIAQEYSKHYPDKIVLLRHERNEGLAAALNDCLAVAKGKYIARMDADDESLPERFQVQVDFLEKHSHVDLVGCAMQVFCRDEDWGVIRKKEFPTRMDLGGEVPFSHPTILARRHVFEKLGGYCVSNITRRCEDRELWFRFFEANFSGVNLPVVLYRYRNGLEAIHQRNFRERWHSLLVSVAGIKRLALPIRFYFFAFARFLRAFVPTRVMRWYQARRKYH